MTTQQQIQNQILAIAQSREFITYLDIEHLGSKNQTDRARTALKNANKLKNIGTMLINGGTYMRMQAVERKQVKRIAPADRWPCGTPRSQKNAFNWQKVV